MNNSLTILCLLMTILCWFFTVGMILNEFYGIAIILMVLSLIFAILFGIRLRNGGNK